MHDCGTVGMGCHKANCLGEQRKEIEKVFCFITTEAVCDFPNLFSSQRVGNSFAER